MYAITGHGLGHLTRSVALMERLHELRPDIAWTISTAIAPERIRSLTRLPFDHRQAVYEPGAVQENCFVVDEARTTAAYRAFLSQRATLLSAEVQTLRAGSFAAVLSDIAALPIAAAGTLGIPAFGIGNFTWDWALAPYLNDPELLTQLAADYSQGERLIRLPLAQPTSPFPVCQDAPMVCRRAQHSRRQTRAILDITHEATVVLVCVGGWSGQGLPPVQIDCPDGLSLLVMGDVPIRCNGNDRRLQEPLPSPLMFPDLVAAADVVLAKAGYGIASECLVHGTPAVLIGRPDFPESAVMAQALTGSAPVVMVDQDTFAAGRLRSALDLALALPPDNPHLEADGATAVACSLLDLLETA